MFFTWLKQFGVGQTRVVVPQVGRLKNGTRVEVDDNGVGRPESFYGNTHDPLNDHNRVSLSSATLLLTNDSVV